MKKIYAFAPISMGNVGVGFDSIGAAFRPEESLPLGDMVSVAPNGSDEADVIRVTDKFASLLPANVEDNIISSCLTLFKQRLRMRGTAPVPVELVLYKKLPVGSGLGSSACSIVAALAALNRFYGDPFESRELLLMMGAMEGKISGSVHYDNVAPSYMGGMQLMGSDEESICAPLPLPPRWIWVLAYPGLDVPTRSAREILPAAYPRETALAQSRSIANFVRHLCKGEWSEATLYMEDVIAEPYRRFLIPHFNESRKELLRRGALAFGISGAGPTVFGLYNDKTAAADGRKWLEDHFLRNERGFTLLASMTDEGVIISDAEIDCASL